ncbi:MAG TPA: RES family NAD+ phosphorylase [Caulobacteraceae bacterium]
MSRSLWRIATDAPTYEAHDLSGKGAEKDGGRWNAPGLPAVYASQTRALACLETVVHLNAGGLPLNRYLVQIDVPPGVWSKAEVLEPSALPVGWDAEPAGKVSIDMGSNWLKAKSSALLLVPSVIVPEEQNVLINPQHPEAGTITAQKVRKWTYDPRLTKKS